MHTKYIDFANFNYSVNISLQYKYIYIETPKVACSTIKTSLMQSELKNNEWYLFDDFEKIHYRELSPLLRPTQIYDINQFFQREDIFKFCFVRNPFTRLLSAYLDKIVGNKTQKKQILQQLGFNPNDLSKNITFDTFVKAVCQQPISLMDPHWRIQYYQTLQDTVKYNYIGKLENFNFDFKHVLNKIEPNYQSYTKVLEKNKTKKQKSIKEYFNNKTKDLIREKYAIDFEHFNYSEDIL